MKVINLDLNNIKDFNVGDIDATIGAYDGIHDGHIAVINELINHKKSKNSAIITFRNHPDIYLHKRIDEGFIETLEDKELIFSALGVDYLIILNELFLDLTYQEFNDFLKKINVKRVVVGSDFVYGKKALGNINTLKKDFIVSVVSLINDSEGKISSSTIRKALNEGRIEDANRILKHPFTVSGIVEHGDKVGTRLGFKTANLDLGDKYHYLRLGTYKVKVLLDNKWYQGIANFGYNPTIKLQSRPRLETHVFDYNGNLYGKNITVSLLKFIRDEKLFDSKEELIKQIEQDIKIAMED